MQIIEKSINFLKLLTRRSDLALAVFLVFVIIMMILPLPTIIVDILIASNMAAAVILLMVGIYIKTPLDFLGFPSVLLLSTLARLALSITTTRLILLDGNAGKIVDTFGNFVVGGNLLVGLVIFLIITIVQFLVITKGSERVAEVSARFSLDGMPGKQMSIDSDMRAGLIDMEQARHRRQMIEKETQLYGAMDGAMKFVKGDAIAGLVIIFVNLLGGVLIGSFQHGLSFSEAVNVYSVLTIGDGMISQIPALFISVCAGIIVTRVSTSDSGDLGADITSQISKKPKALLVASAILLGFAMVPGFPSMVFLGISALVGFAGVYGFHRDQLNGSGGEGTNPSDSTVRYDNNAASGSAKEHIGMTTPITIELPMSLAHSKTLTADLWREELKKMRDSLYQNLGVPFPGVAVRYCDHVDTGFYRLLIHEIPVAFGELPANQILVKNSDNHLEVFGIEYKPLTKPIYDLNAVWVDASHTTAIEKSGVTYLHGAAVVSYHLYNLLIRQASEFVGIQETKVLLTKVESSLSELVREAQRLLPIQKIADIFQRLVSEGISIRNLRSILESIVEWGGREKDVVQLAEYVRTGQKRFICHKFGGAQRVMPAYLIEESAEETIRSGIRMTSAGAYLALDPDVTARFIKNIKAAIGKLESRADIPVLITSMDVRRYIRKLIELDLFELPVISFQELTQDVTVQPLGRIGIA